MCATGSFINFDEYFEKKFAFKAHSDWNLPDASKIFTKSRWFLAEFQEKKIELNAVKSQLNDFDLDKWSKYTKSRDHSGSIIHLLKKNVQPELLTQAWCKFYECLSHYPIVPSKNLLTDNSLNSLHLCEAPGAFICSLNHKLKSDQFNVQWKWLSTTLNPDYEGNNLHTMIPDDRFIMHTFTNWYFGADFSGDILKYYNYKSLMDAVKSMQPVMIVTADGSVDCMEDPGNQEGIVEYLHYCEAMIALNVLHEGGTLVIKMFTMFEDSSICLMYLLNCCFQQVHVFKPCTSKSGNSEVYVICLLYKGKNFISKVIGSLMLPYENPKVHTFSLFPKEIIPDSFLSQIYDCSIYFMRKQIRTISENIKYFKENNISEHKRICHLKSSIANYFSLIYGIEKINRNCKIVPLYNISEYFSCYFCKQWNATNKWTSCNDEICINTKSLFYDFKNLCDCKLRLVKGKIVNDILHSKFCAKENLTVFKNVYKSEYLRNDQFSTTDCVQLGDISFTNASEFDKNCFKILNNMLKKCPDKISLIEIPILSNFLCGVLYILCFAFKNFNLSSLGVITFSNPVNYEIVNKYFDEISQSLAKLKFYPEREFKIDILQVLPCTLLNRKLFYDSVWQYNNRLSEIYREKYSEISK